jgi:homoserine O-acetyltransferase
MQRIRKLALGVLFVCAVPALSQQQFAVLGDFKLQSGEILRDCRIGYRTFGVLNPERSNAVLVPTWAGGTTEQLQGAIGAGKLYDSSRYFVIAVDALANGVSSSPSNSAVQPRMMFPAITIRDMVETQYALLTRVLGITHLKAVAGVSMGGMQTFQWMVSHPGFMDVAIPIVGSPRLAAYDVMQWQAQADAIVNDRRWDHGNYTQNFTAAQEAEFGAVLLSTPDDYNAHTTREQALAKLQAAQSDTHSADANNKLRQVQAMLGLDVSDAFAGSMDQAAAAVKARVLVIVAVADHTVTPGPAREFARLIHAPVLALDSDCGHMAPGCEQAKVTRAVNDFIGQ